MRPLYFCANCRQYHATCNAKQLHPSNSIKYLRFSDLFNAAPLPHPQNFTINSPRRPEDSRLVYQDQVEQADNKTRSSHLRIAHNRGYYRNEHAHSSGFKESRATVDDRYNFSQNKSNNHSINTKSKSVLKSQKSLAQSSEKQARTEKKIVVTGSYSKNTQSKIKQQVNQSNKKNGPYYVVTRLRNYDDPSNQKVLAEGATQDTSAIVLQSRNGSRFLANGFDDINSRNKTGIKGSYVYGDYNRKILTSNKKITQFQYGELIQSREEEGQYPLNDAHPIENGSLNERKGDMNEIRSQREQNEGNRVHHVDKMGELRRILKENEKNYKQEREIDPPNRSKAKRDVSPNGIIKISESSNALTPDFEDASISTARELKVTDKVRQHRDTESQQCKYYDNRCLGLSFSFCCKEADVDRIHETDLV